MLPLRIDHIVIAISDLAVAKESFRTLYGLESVGGGRHDGAGTENLIIALDDGYLELATVVDTALAVTNPFGRLVSFALDHQLLLAGWAVSLTGVPAESVSHQHLTRDGVAVDLYGVDEVIDGSDRPFGLLRPAGQAVPGSGAATAPRLADMHVVRRGAPVPTSLTSEDAVVECGGRARGGRLTAVVLERPDGIRLTIDQHTRELICR